MDRRSFLVGGAGAAASLSAPLSGSSLASSAKAEWTPLFDGRNLDDWTFYQEGVGDIDRMQAVSWQDDALHFLGDAWTGGQTAPFGHIITKRLYRNYHLRFEYRWGKRRYRPRALAKRNSGLRYHLQPKAGVSLPDAVEFQIQESDVGDAILVNTQAISGPSLGGSPAWPNLPGGASRDYPEPSVAGGVARQWYRHHGDFEAIDAWNRLDLIAFEDRAAHLVNGRIVNTIYDICWRAPNADGAFVPLTGGQIALQFEAAEIAYRNIMLRPIGPDDLAGPLAE